MYLFQRLYMFRAASAHHQEGPPDDEHLLLETYRGVEINTLKKCIKLVIN